MKKGFFIAAASLLLMSVETKASQKMCPTEQDIIDCVKLSNDAESFKKIIMQKYNFLTIASIHISEDQNNLVDINYGKMSKGSLWDFLKQATKVTFTADKLPNTIEFGKDHCRYDVKKFEYGGKEEDELYTLILYRNTKE